MPSRVATTPIREPHPGFAEQSPEDWWKATGDCLQRLLRLESLADARVRAVGLSGQMHGLVLLDRDGNPLRNAIIWPDTRTADICREWSETIGTEAIGNITGLPLATGFLAPSLSWVKRNEPHVYRRAAHALLPKDYIRYRLTGVLATDVTDASGSLLFDVARRQWSRELLKKFDLDDRLLPAVVNTTSVAGNVTESAANATGLPAGIPVAAGGADIAMAALALGVGRPGIVAVSISTGGTVITGIDRLVLDRRMHTFCRADQDQWILMGASLSAGLSLSWFARNVATPLGAHAHERRRDGHRRAFARSRGDPGGFRRPALCSVSLWRADSVHGSSCEGVFHRPVTEAHPRPHGSRNNGRGRVFALRVSGHIQRVEYSGERGDLLRRRVTQLTLAADRGECVRPARHVASR